MSDQYPVVLFHRASREVPELGCVLDPWVARRAFPCPEEPGVGLEPMDCGEGALNKFKELPVIIRGAVMTVPYLDLGEVRTDPALMAARVTCAASGPVINLGGVFERHGRTCEAACGELPYCGTPSDPMGMEMLACYEDFDVFDPGFIAAGNGPSGALVPGLRPPPVSPECPSGSSQSSECVPAVFDSVVNVFYIGGCLFSRNTRFTMCGGRITEEWLPDVLLGCDCCHSSSASSSPPPPPPPRSSSSSSSMSSSSSSGSSESSSSSRIPSGYCVYTTTVYWDCIGGSSSGSSATGAWKDFNGLDVDWNAVPAQYVGCVPEEALGQYTEKMGRWWQGDGDCVLVWTTVSNACHAMDECETPRYDILVEPGGLEPTTLNIRRPAAGDPGYEDITVATFKTKCCCGNCVNVHIEPVPENWPWKDSGADLSQWTRDFCGDITKPVNYSWSFPDMTWAGRKCNMGNFTCNSGGAHIHIGESGSPGVFYMWAGANVTCDGNSWTKHTYTFYNPVAGEYQTADIGDGAGMFLITVSRTDCPCPS